MIVNNVGIGSYNYVNNFRAKSDRESMSVVSLKDADDLKYDVEYNKLSRLKNDVNIIGDDINIYFRNGISNSQVSGMAYNHFINLEYACKGFNPNKMIIKGKIDNKEVSLKYDIMGNNVNITGNISEIDDNVLTLMNMLARDFSDVVSNQMNLATFVILG